MNVLVDERVAHAHPPLPLLALEAEAAQLWGGCYVEPFEEEDDIECWFGKPIASGDRVAVEWWASSIEQGQELTFAGVTVLRFYERGKVIEHRDYDSHVERRRRPYAQW